MSQLHLAMRHLKLECRLSPNPNLGEALYTLTTSNFEFPKGYALSDVLRVRRDLIMNIHGGTR